MTGLAFSACMCVAMAEADGDSPAVWVPKPAEKHAVVKPSRVRIVDFGADFLRDGDGRPVHQFSVHRYKVEKDHEKGVWSPVNDFQLDLDHDVDGDGRNDDDVVGYHEFSLTRPFSPQASWYDSLAGSPRWYGAEAIFQANRRTTSFSENGVNHEHDGPNNYPRDNWALFHEHYEINSPYRMYGLWLWQQHDFLNGGADYRVSFDRKSEIALYLQRYWMGCEGLRFVIRDAGQFYISEATFSGAGQVYGSGGGKQHVLCPHDTRWAKYNPKAPHDIEFFPDRATFEPHDFRDVQAVGWLVYKQEMIPAYFGFKWYAFEADAVVHRKARPSEHVDMVEVPQTGDQGPATGGQGAGTADQGVPAFYVSTCEVPYLLWKNVFRLARSNTFVRNPRGFVFDQDGDMGSMDFPAAEGRLASHDPNEPVTDVTLLDVAAWCNALSEQESRTPCYYEDPQFETVFRLVKRSPLYGPQRVPPRLYVRWSADGYRLPTPAEWHETFDSKADVQQAWVGDNSKATTHDVGTKKPNARGVYDTIGNVWELVWTYGDVLDPGTDDLITRGVAAYLRSKSESYITALGGGFEYPKDPAHTSANPYGDEPFDGNYSIGFRLVRREPGLPAPAELREISPAVPRWTVRKGQEIRAVRPLANFSKPLLAMETVPGLPLQMAKYETTFANWKRVFDWAVAGGYLFDHDGDMGSMDYWGMDDWGVAHPHTPNEPVTDLTYYDCALFCNALSEMEGRTPVYYHDKACTQAYRTAFVYRPLMTLFFETFKDSNDGLIAHDHSAAEPVYVKRDADGYRLPTEAEHDHARTGGNRRRYSWGNEPKDGGEYAWLFDTSDGTTHPVGRKRPNSLGLFDMEGNVSEIADNRHNDRGGAGLYRLGGSFEVLTVGTASREAPFSPVGWGYPDIGFRVVRQLPDEADDAPAGKPVTFSKPVAPKAELKIDTSKYDPLCGQVHRGSLLRDGVFDATGVESLGGLKWKFSTGGPIKSSPVVVDGIAYFGSYDGNIYAVDAETGHEVWKVTTKDKVSGSAAVVAGVVYIAGEDGNMYALDAKTGKQKWVTRLGRGRPAGSPAVAYGVVYMPTGNRGGAEIIIMSSGPTVGLDSQSGEQIWTARGGSQGYSAPAIFGDTLWDGHFAADLRTGAKRKGFSMAAQSRQFVNCAVSDGIAYGIGTICGDIAAVDVKTLDRVWYEFTLEGQTGVRHDGKSGYEIFTGPAVAHGRVFVGCNDHKLHTFDAKTGNRGWTFQTGGEVQSSPSVAGETIYFGSHDGNLYANNAITGKPLWKYKTAGKIVSSPWPGDGVIYVGCDDGSLYALESDTN
jgi:outer membrane protein assembly factor BamB/formylglycine-generating enzyme required for sulfatase activity